MSPSRRENPAPSSSGAGRPGEICLCSFAAGKPPEQLTAYQKKNFLNGPGKLCKALALTRAENGCSLLGEELFVCDALEDIGLTTPAEDKLPLDIRTSSRIGIDYAEEAVHFPWRYFLPETALPNKKRR